MTKTVFSTFFFVHFLLIGVSMAGTENNIHGGFYIKLGAALPVGKFAQAQVQSGSPLIPKGTIPALNYLPAKAGPAMDLGFLIYLGPSFAHHVLRAGIDATFLSFWINLSKADSAGAKTDYYYYFVGQKFGPVLTINPVDHLMIDLSYKLNANVGYHFDQWHYLSDKQYSKYGYDLLYQEVSLSIRYRIVSLSVMYNIGKMPYNDFDTSKSKQTIETNTVRIMIGLKF